VADPRPWRLEPAWQLGDFRLQSAAVDFWMRNLALPDGVDARERARQLTTVAFAGDEAVGASTAVIRPMPQVRQRLGMFRCSVAPEFRRTRMATEMAVMTRDPLEVWAKANPQQRVKGMGCVIQGVELEAKKAQAHWPLSGLALAGYNERDEQVRVVWFKDATID